MGRTSTAPRCSAIQRLLMPYFQHLLRARRAQLDNFTDASTSVGNIAWRGNVNRNPTLREVVEPFPAAPANCTMRQFRQTTPAVPQPPSGHKLIFHSLSGCWLDPAQARPAPGPALVWD